MTGEPQTWHYGLVARWWAEFNLDGPEIEFYRPFVVSGQPVLDLACGTGRLLVPYLRAGVDIDGCDISQDMLELCRERAEREGLRAPRLYAQAMHELDLPRRYGTIVVCGGFGLGGRREHDVEALRRMHEHLRPGGLLLLDNEVPYAMRHWWRSWSKDERGELPRPWRERGDRRLGADGVEYEIRTRLVDLDPLAQRISVEIRATASRNGEQLAEELRELVMTVYFTEELRLLLERAGFGEIEVSAGYRDEPPTHEDDFVVFLARKR